MRKFVISIVVIFLFNLPAYSGIVQGGVQKEMIVGQNRIVDSRTNTPISGAKIYLPQLDYSTYTNSDGKFALDADITGATVLSVEKDGYKPYTLTVNQNSASHPLTIGIEKTTPKDISIETQMFHLGDNSFSDLSANSRDFQVQAIGPYYSKKFLIPSVSQGAHIYLIIGSIIGVDTKKARSMGQNKISSAYASPPEVYFNGNKISEIQINGDGQKIKIPYNLIKQGQKNEVTIKTGRNMAQTAYVDYDDIEFMNLAVETR